MFDKTIEDFVVNTGDSIILEYINGLFVLQNKSFVEGKKTDIKIKATGTTLNICVDNFVYQLQKLKHSKASKDEMDIDLYRWLCSY